MAESKKSDTITIKKDDLWKYSTFVLGAVVIILLIVMFSGNGLFVKQVTNDEDDLVPPQGRVEVQIEDTDWVKGDSSAPILIVEYSDFQCPFCSKFYMETLGQIEQKYVDTEEVAFVYRHFPLNSIHPEAQKSAEAAECAGEQNKFWEMHDILFENQISLSISNYKAWAGELGLNQNKFDSCLDSGKYGNKVGDQLQQGAALGIRGTPGFFLNGRTISGACPIATFDAAIKAEQEGKNWAVTNCQVTVA